jgi:DNA invertase Pin-like site-specific DNA recombinase
MSTAKYIRVSTAEQNTSRQENTEHREYIDKISGRTAFASRPQAKKLMADIKDGDINKVVVHSIDRLGRDTPDVLNTINWFTQQGVPVTSEKEGFTTLDKNGKENPTSKMVISIMATLAEWDYNLKREAQMEGIERAKQRDLYKGGRPKDTDQGYLAKDKNQRILKFLNQGFSIRETMHKAKASDGTVQRVKRTATKLGVYNPPSPNKANEDKLRQYGLDKGFDDTVIR